nr:single-stranded-DNA-specific exonuclease [Lacticaseibacillus nasuensis]
MTAAKYEWQTQTAPAAAEISEVAQALQVPAFLARLLAQRGITSQADYDAFTTPDVARLHDPFALHDMTKAVARIQQAVANQEKNHDLWRL